MTRFVSEPNPPPGCVTSFATIRESLFSFSFLLAFLRRSPVSAANPTTHAGRARRRDDGEDVGRALELDGRGAGVLLQLLGGRTDRPEVRDGRRHDERVRAGTRLEDGIGHLLRGCDVDARGAHGRRPVSYTHLR